MSNANFRRMSALHQLVLRLSGGRLGSRALGMRVVELHTVGRKSGQPRDTVLTAPVDTPEAIVLVASKGGSHGQPDWFLNLRANPDVEITVDGTRRPYTAHVASADEKAILWLQIVAANKGYAGYQERTEREIPVVVCEPR